MKLDELIEKFNNATLKVDLGNKIFSLEIRLEAKEQESKQEVKIDVQEKNTESKAEEKPEPKKVVSVPEKQTKAVFVPNPDDGWKPLEINDDEYEEVPVEPYPMTPSDPLVLKSVKHEKPIDSKNNESKHPDETGWFKTSRPYGAKFVAHYFVDGISCCDDGSVKKSHMLDDKCQKIDGNSTDETISFCTRCRAIRKDVKQQTGETALPDGYTGWARRNGGGNHHAHFVISNGKHISVPCKLGIIDPKKWHKIEATEDHETCEVCRLASQDYIKLTPENIYDTFRKNTIMLSNPVPLSEPKLPIASDDDVLIEAAKRCLDKNKKVVVHEMRVKSAMDNTTIESMPVFFFTTDKVVKIEARREGLNRNANVIPVKITVHNRSDEEILNPSFDINFFVSKTRKEMRRNK